MNPPSPAPLTNETVLYAGSPHALLRIGWLLLAALLCAGGVVLGLKQHPAFFGLTGVGVVIGLVAILQQKATYYEITSERLRIKRGLFTRRTEETELYRVKDATLIEPFPLRLFGLGHIEISSNDENSPNILLRGLTHPQQVREALRQSIEACRERKRVRVTEVE